jgi:hypothetical protein
MQLSRILLWIFIFLTALFYGVIFAGQVLGMLKIYNLALAISASLLSGGLIFFLLAANRRWFAFLDSDDTASANFSQRLLNVSLALAGLALFIVLALYPLARWPFSPISQNLNWDAGLYHFPKAIEMLSTGSAWDMTIDYGEYPFGYESLLALAFGLNHDGYLLGLTHALIAFYFFLAWWLLVVRFTRLPHGLVIFLVALLTISRLYLPKNDNNIWWIIWTQVILIGKNDLLLGAALLAIVLFTPSGDEKERSYLPGLAVSSMLALSIKPNAALLVVFAWGVGLFFLARSQGVKIAFKTLAVQALLVLPGILWAFRNLFALHSLFKSNAARLSSWSIAANLTNPYFFEHIPTQLYLVLGIVLVTMLAALFWKKIRLPALIGLVLLLTFALTPASAFLGNNQQPTQIAWRFAVGLLAYQAVLLLVLLEPVIRKIYAWVAPRFVFSALVIFLAVGIGAVGLRLNRGLLEYKPGGDWVLRDQFEQPVGVNGYFSAYDYVQNNAQKATVIVENGLPYYLYDEHLTNTVTRSRDADYFVAFKTAWIKGRKEGFPEMISQPEFEQNWELVYEDSEGRVYKRKP